MYEHPPITNLCTADLARMSIHARFHHNRRSRGFFFVTFLELEDVNKQRVYEKLNFDSPYIVNCIQYCMYSFAIYFELNSLASLYHFKLYTYFGFA